MAPPAARRPRRRRALPLAVAGLLGALLALAPLQPAGAQAPAGGEEDLLSGFDAPVEPAPAPGDDGASDTGGADDDLLSGFDDGLPAADATDAEASAAADGWWELDGFLRLDSSYNYAHDPPPPGGTDFRGLSKLRLTLRLELALELGARWDAYLSGQAFRDFAYQINGEEQYTQAVLETHQDEVELREAWLRGTPWPSLDVKLGRQIVVWGKSDNIRVVDVLNPLDNREPGLTDLEDLRLPLSMTRLDWFVGDWGLTAIAIHEVRFDKNPAPGSDFLPVPPASLPPERIPENGSEESGNTEYAAAASGIFSGWDLALYWAQVFDDTPHVVDADPGPFVVLVREHAPVTMGGLAVNVALGSWLLKSEVARFSGLRFFNAPRETFVRWDGLLGLEYSGFTDTTLGLELAGRRIRDYDPRLAEFPDDTPRDVNQYVLSYRGSYLRETLDVVAVLSYFGREAEEGGIQRYQVTYELATALDLTGGVVLYTPGDGQNTRLVAAQDNDRVFLDLKWSF